ncbi:DUF58 domain-containing protein [Paraliobacillus ryukyuensis]|uniref:DUF58 domain-containing protein n=1 Tax=Paraliobacillus ryukyuensis TaxID=200904 RepID=UPI0009A59943|nr:DUF58 domain-containing protein [Paraliobacillus ryukyuensis]
MSPARFFLKLIQLLVLFGVLFSYAMFQGGFVSWFLFYSFVPMFIYFLLFLFYPLSTWKLKRVISKRVQYTGGEIQVTLELTQRFRIPIPFLIIEDCFSESLTENYYDKNIYQLLDERNTTRAKRQQKNIRFPLFAKQLTYTYEMSHLPRGKHAFQAVRLKTSDFFGFIKKEYIIPLEDQLVVYPRSRKLAVKQKQRYTLEEGASPIYSVHSSNTHVVTGVREYMPGDKFSWIDWKTTARKQEVMTKEFEQEKNADELLIMDSTYSPNSNLLAFEACVELIQSFINHYSNTSVNVGLLGVGEKSVYFPPAQHGKKDAIQHYLAQVQPNAMVDFSTQLSKQVKQLPTNLVAHVFVSQLTKEHMQAFEQLRKQVKHVVVYFVKASSKWTDNDQWLMQQCSNVGITINPITKEALQQDTIEVVI